MHDRTGFQRDDPAAIAGRDGPMGVDVTGERDGGRQQRRAEREREGDGSN